MRSYQFDEDESLVVLKGRMARDYKAWGAKIHEVFSPGSFGPGPRHVPIELDDGHEEFHLEERLFGRASGGALPEAVPARDWRRL